MKYLDVTLVSGPLVMMSLAISDVTNVQKAPDSSLLSARCLKAITKIFYTNFKHKLKYVFISLQFL